MGLDLIYSGTKKSGTCVLTWGRDGAVYLHNVDTGHRIGSLCVQSASRNSSN